METPGTSKHIVKYLLLAAGLVLCILNFERIIGIAALLWKIVFPLVLGFIFAYVLNILVTKFESIYFPRSRKKLVQRTRKPVSILLSIITIVLIILLVICIVLPQTAKALVTVSSAIPEAVDAVNAWIIARQEKLPIIAERIREINIDWSGISKSIANYALNGIGGLLTSTFGLASNLISGLFTLLMAASFSVYLLIGKEKLVPQVKRVQKAYMKEQDAKKLNDCLAVAHESFSSYITGQCAEAMILGTLCILGMWVFGFPYAATTGIFVGATALIPIVGAYLGAGVGALLILTVDPLKAVLFLVYIIVLQQLENNLIYPKVVGKSVGLPGIWVLVSVVVGGGLFGVFGMMISVPFTATIYKLFQTETRNRLRTKSK